MSISLNMTELVSLYENGSSLTELGNRFGCSRQVIKTRLENLGIPIRGRNGTTDEYSLDEGFFSKWSSQMAYILGYIYADGCIRPDKYELAIKSIDYELLEYVKNSCQSSVPIKPVTNASTYSLAIYSKRFIDDLMKLGITPRKSLGNQFPKVPERFFWDFLRGEVDGDGHIWPPKTDCNTVSFQITGNEHFLNYTKDRLRKKIKMHDYALNPQGKAFALCIHGESAYTAMREMYDNEKYGLGRKKIMAMNCLAHFTRPHFCRLCHAEIDFERRNKQYCNRCRTGIQRQANAKSYRKRMAREQ